MSWKGFMRRLVIGKQATNDFSSEDLPKNRRQVLKFIYKHRFLTLFTANLLFILFAMPFFVWELLTYLAKFTDTSLGDKEFLRVSGDLLYSSNMLRIPFLMLASIGLAGMAYVVRKLCWNEPVSMWKDFRKGIKNSWKSFLGISLILGIFIFVTEWVIYTFSAGGFSDFTGVLLLILAVIFMLIMTIVSIYAFGLASLYGMNFFDLYKASFMITLKTLFYNIWMVIVAFLPIAIFFIIPMPLFYYLGIFVIVFGGTGYSFACSMLFMLKNFDKFINGTSYPEFVDKGIYKPELDQFEEDFSADDIQKMAEQLAQDPMLELGSEGEEVEELADQMADQLIDELDIKD